MVLDESCQPGDVESTLLDGTYTVQTHFITEVTKWISDFSDVFVLYVYPAVIFAMASSWNGWSRTRKIWEVRKAGPSEGRRVYTVQSVSDKSPSPLELWFDLGFRPDSGETMKAMGKRLDSMIGHSQTFFLIEIASSAFSYSDAEHAASPNEDPSVTKAKLKMFFWHILAGQMFKDKLRANPGSHGAAAYGAVSIDVDLYREIAVLLGAEQTFDAAKSLAFEEASKSKKRKKRAKKPKKKDSGPTFLMNPFKSEREVKDWVINICRNFARVGIDGRSFRSAKAWYNGVETADLCDGSTPM